MLPRTYRVTYTKNTLDVLYVNDKSVYLIRWREPQRAEHRQVDGSHDHAAHADPDDHQPVLRPVVVNLRGGAQYRHSWYVATIEMFVNKGWRKDSLPIGF